MAVWCRVSTQWAIARSGALNRILRSRCVGCRQWGSEALCADCIHRLEALPARRCPCCQGLIRRHCLLCEPDPPPFERVQALGKYTGVLRAALRALKYDGRIELGSTLGDLLADTLNEQDSDWLIVPVPLAPERFRQRGYNQAEAIARAIALRRGWKLDSYGLRRTGRPDPLYQLGRADRWHHLARAFEAAKSFQGAKVLLVDDILTSGATISHAAETLRRAGAARVRVAAVARAFR